VKPLPILAFATMTAACVIASMRSTAGLAYNEASQISGVTIPTRYRQWQVVAPFHEAGI